MTKGQSGQCAYIDAARFDYVHLKDMIRTGKGTGPGAFSGSFQVHAA